MLHVALVRKCLRSVIAAGCCATLLACSGGSGPGTTTSGSADAIARYGQAAPRDPAGFTYQPDVVVVDGGPEAVRSVSADGLVWTVDGKASGLDGLDVGEAMFLTSRAAGRVAAKEPAGDDVAITLAPVQLNEIIRDGHIKSEIPTRRCPAEAAVAAATIRRASRGRPWSASRSQARADPGCRPQRRGRWR